jgi:hypothetical protein
MARSAKLNLQHSICTDTPVGADLFAIGDDSAKHLQNTGIERNSGLTPIYEKETTFPTAGVSTIIAKDGTVVQVDASNNVRLNDRVIGNVGPLAIKNRGVLSGYLDAAWTADETLIAINRIGTSMYVYEIDPATGTVLHSRSNAFAGFPSGPIGNICLVKYVDMHYADNQEFVVQLGGPTGTASANAYILKESGTSTTLITGSNAKPCRYFVWRFSTGKYISGKQGLNISSVPAWFIGDLTGAGDTNLVNVDAAKPVVNITIDRFPGTAFSRAILTLPPGKNTANLFSGYGEVGYTSAGVYSASPVFYGIALGAATVTVQNPIFGMGYSECDFTRSDFAGQIFYYYAAPFAHNVAAYYLASSCATNTPINGYGKLTDIFNTTSGANVVNLVSWRVIYINGQQSFLSAAPIGTTWDCIGVPITNVGEFDEIFTPHIDDNGSTYSRILYRYHGQLFYVNITSTATHTLQRVGDNLYTVNCISAINAVDVRGRKLATGTNDYNGRLIQFSAAAIVNPTYKVVGLMQEAFSNSTDFGDKLSTALSTAALAAISPYDYLSLYLFCPGIESPSFIDRSSDFSVDVYLNDVYFGSFIAYASPIVKADLGGTLYVSDTRLPFAMGYSFQERTMQTEVETIFTGVGVTGSADIDFDYLGYELGNDTPALYQSFVLFGQTYLFDGKQIWFASFTGALFAGRGSSPICPATGMQLIASSPTEVFFLSLQDNSIYSFDGGRSLQKVNRMNDLRNSVGALETIINGVFSVRDNTLLLQTASTFVWIRDKIVSQNAKKANQTAIALYDTQLGIFIANNTLSWQYTFFALAGSTVVPFTWQSGYFGVTDNKLGIFSAFDLTFYCAAKSAASIIVTFAGFDADEEWTETVPYNIKPGDWTPLGFYRAKVTPAHTLGLALSIGIQTSSYIVLNEVIAEFTPSVSTAVSAGRSK